MAANKARGEVTLTLDGQEFVLRPSYEAIQQFEQQTGKGVFELARAALDGKLTATDMATVATECIRAWGRQTEDTSAKGANSTRIGEMMAEADGGWIAALNAIGELLANAAMGGYTAKGEVKAETAKK
jgi:hypothetical protein